MPNGLSGLKQLRRLILRSNQLLETPPVLKTLHNLIELDLTDNELKKLNGFIGNLRQLQVLIVSENELEKIPLAVGNLQGLRHLDLSFNYIKRFPKALLHLNQLNYLDISNNEINSLPKSIGTLTNLKSLHMRDNLLKNLPKSLGLLKQLRSLDLAFNQVKKLPESFIQLFQLKALELQGNPLENPPLGVALSGIYAVMMYLNHHIDVVNEHEIKHLSLEVSNGKKTALRHFLSFFSTFSMWQTGQKYNLEVIPTKKGLRLALVYSDLMELQEQEQLLYDFLNVLSLETTKTATTSHLSLSDKQWVHLGKLVQLAHETTYLLEGKTLNVSQLCQSIHQQIVPKINQFKADLDMASPQQASN